MTFAPPSISASYMSSNTRRSTAINGVSGKTKTKRVADGRVIYTSTVEFDARFLDGDNAGFTISVRDPTGSNAARVTLDRGVTQQCIKDELLKARKYEYDEEFDVVLPTGGGESPPLFKDISQVEFKVTKDNTIKIKIVYEVTGHGF